MPNASSTGSAPSRATRDRKSTRLNSSHSQISYAVFCLKKKNNHNLTQKDHDLSEIVVRTNSLIQQPSGKQHHGCATDCLTRDIGDALSATLRVSRPTAY